MAESQMSIDEGEERGVKQEAADDDQEMAENPEEEWDQDDYFGGAREG